MESSTKVIRIKFNHANPQQETLIRRFIQTNLLKYPAVPQAPVIGAAASNIRTDFRLTLRDVRLKMQTRATRTLPAHDIDVQLLDISAGGACIAVPKNVPLAVNCEISMDLGFITPSLTVLGIILGLRK